MTDAVAATRAAIRLSAAVTRVLLVLAQGGFRAAGSAVIVERDFLATTELAELASANDAWRRHYKDGVIAVAPATQP